MFLYENKVEVFREGRTMFQHGHHSYVKFILFLFKRF